MSKRTNFILLGGDIEFESKEEHNSVFKFDMSSNKDLLIEKLLADNKELTKKLKEKEWECTDKELECRSKEKFCNEIIEENVELKIENVNLKSENKELKSENKKLNEIVVTGKTEIAILDKAFNDYRNQPKVRRLKACAVKDIIKTLVRFNGMISKHLIVKLANKHNVAIKTVINLYLRKTHVKSWSMLDDNKLWDIRKEIVDLV